MLLLSIYVLLSVRFIFPQVFGIRGGMLFKFCYTPGRSACGSALAFSGRTPRCSLTSNHLFKALFLLLFFVVVVVVFFFFFGSSPPHTLKLLA